MTVNPRTKAIWNKNEKPDINLHKTVFRLGLIFSQNGGLLKKGKKFLTENLYGKLKKKLI